MSNKANNDTQVIDDYFSDWDVLRRFEERMSAIKFADRVSEVVRLIKQLGIYNRRTINDNVDYVFDMAIPRFLHNKWS